MTGAAATPFPVFAATAFAARDQLIVSVHDVAPQTRAGCETILHELGRHGVDVCSLLVVPNYHQSGTAWKDVKFMNWLRELEGAGHEIVIHGYYHQRPAQEEETFGDRFLTRYYVKGEAEFYDLEYQEAFRRITRARDAFVAAALRPRGFIAPGWLLGSEAERAAADAEMEYTTRLTTIVDLREREAFRARSLVYSVRSAWRRRSSLAWNDALSRLQSSNALVRLGIHPPDLTHPKIWAQITRLIDGLVASRTPTTYRDWIAERRLDAASKS